MVLATKGLFNMYYLETQFLTAGNSLVDLSIYFFLFFIARQSNVGDLLKSLFTN